jgi:hypothetical protein
MYGPTIIAKTEDIQGNWTTRIHLTSTDDVSIPPKELGA